MTTQRCFNPERPLGLFTARALALIVGGSIGIFIGAIVSGIPLRYFLQEYGLLVRILILSVLFGAVINFFFSTRSRLSEYK